MTYTVRKTKTRHVENRIQTMLLMTEPVMMMVMVMVRSKGKESINAPRWGEDPSRRDRACVMCVCGAVRCLSKRNAIGNTDKKSRVFCAAA